MSVIMFPGHRHARASTGGGYRSGRSSCRGMPEACSTASTRKGGTSSHCEIACALMSRTAASFAWPPAACSARLRASLGASMGRNPSTALLESQATLHCAAKVVLYAIGMTLQNRIKLARERAGLTQRQVGDAFGITDKAVSHWERPNGRPDLEKIPALGRLFKVPLEWLLAGSGPPPNINDRAARIDALPPSAQSIIDATLEALERQRGKVA